MKKAQLQKLSAEWESMASQAKNIIARKKETRESLEAHFSRHIIPRINRELNGTGIGYFFEKRQFAGFTAEGPLSFTLYPKPTHAWRKKDKHHGWVDYGRANQLTKTVMASNAMREFRKDFSCVSIRVEANFLGERRMSKLKVRGEKY